MDSGSVVDGFMPHEAPPAETPLFVPVGPADPEMEIQLARAADASRCRVFAAVAPATGAVVAGLPADLHALRNRLIANPGLDAVRARIEMHLGERAAPGGLPRLTEAAMKRTEVAAEMPVEPGTTLLVSKEFSFDAAHNLPRYAGKCEHLHGHTFKVRVTVKAPLDTWSGMAFDFMDLKAVVNERVVKVLDHAYINEIIPNPSAEFMAIWIWRKLADLPLHEIQVWETPTSYVTYQGPPAAAR